MRMILFSTERVTVNTRESFLFILFLAGVVVFEAFNFADFKSSVDSVKNFDFSGTSTTFSTAVFAYLSHPNVLEVFKVLPLEYFSLNLNSFHIGTS